MACTAFYSEAGLFTRALECGNQSKPELVKAWRTPTRLEDCILHSVTSGSRSWRLPTSILRHDLPFAGIFLHRYTMPAGFVLGPPRQGQLGCSYAFDTWTGFPDTTSKCACAQKRPANRSACAAHQLLAKRTALCSSGGLGSVAGHGPAAGNCCWRSTAGALAAQKAFLRLSAASDLCVREPRMQHNQVQRRWEARDIRAIFYADVAGYERARWGAAARAPEELDEATRGEMRRTLRRSARATTEARQAAAAMASAMVRRGLPPPPLLRIGVAVAPGLPRATPLALPHFDSPVARAADPPSFRAACREVSLTKRDDSGARDGPLPDIAPKLQ